MSDSVQPHRRQPTRLLHPWDSPGKNTGVGCHFLLQYVPLNNLNLGVKLIEVRVYVLFDFELSALSSVSGIQ